ncbi:hypothetical protein KJ953_00100 [Patescibacteria group bacterium]|nr:hypothetical protein [Patescibacteria group bacterium]MBU1256539.1 hypothetical protein [Patescibacteria group bacterium]MBU1457103.1 hypothetical protein [Patescibacteria group bacterium]
MNVKISPSDLFLLGLAVIGDITETCLVGSSYAMRYNKLNWYFPPNYKKANYTKTLYKKIKAKQINREVNLKNEQLKILLSTTGKQYLQDKFPLTLLQQKTWNKQWCLATFDIPESQKNTRNQLRRKLKQVGFAQLQKSLYISPHPINSSLMELINALNLSKHVLVFQGKQKHFTPTQKTINRLWNLNSIKSDYFQVMKYTKKDHQKAVHQYLQTVAQDPHLPFELLPPDWPATKAKLVIKQITSQPSPTTKRSFI